MVKTPEKQGAVQGYAGSAAGTFALVAVLSFRLAGVHGAGGRERKEIGR
ncbi:MAG: hypothetical protein JXA08_08065 [Methanomicrobiaceae archaeon]|nr:hypothetical protein [Methanomicrobiaceae archaeon]